MSDSYIAPSLGHSIFPSGVERVSNGTKFSLVRALFFPGSAEDFSSLGMLLLGVRGFFELRRTDCSLAFIAIPSCCLPIIRRESGNRSDACHSAEPEREK
jgi:hypothetical protein